MSNPNLDNTPWREMPPGWMNQLGWQHASNHSFHVSNGGSIYVFGAHNSVTTDNSDGDTIGVVGAQNSVTLGNGNGDVVGLGGEHNTVQMGSGDRDGVGVGTHSHDNTFRLGTGNHDWIADYGSRNTVFLSSSTGAVGMHGSGDVVHTGGGIAGVLDYGGGNATLDVGAAGGTTFFSGFQASDLISLNPALGFTSAADALSAIHSDGHGGSLLSLHGHGVIDFVGLSQDQLHTSNFSIG